MKKRIILLLLAVIALAGCTMKREKVEQPDIGKPSEPIVEPIDEIVDENNVSQEPLHIFKADPSSFHFVADWLTDSEILYVEMRSGVYQVKSFNLETGESNLVYEDESYITDIIVHPSLNYLLVHTSDQSDLAVVKVVSMDGVVQHQVEITSTELAIEWNDLDPEKILFTAFHEDWSFDLFVFNGHTEGLSIIEMDDPFPKWIGDNRIANMLFSEHPLDGGEIQFLNIATGATERYSADNVIYFDAYEDNLLIVQSLEADNFTYSLRNGDGTVLAEWIMKPVSNYSEWVVPEVEWINGESFLYKGASRSGQLDELSSEFNLYLQEVGNPKIIIEGLDADSLTCSPSGKRCLNGYTFEEVIDVESGERLNWIEFDK